MTPHDWNAADYDRTNAGVIALGLEVLERLDLRGDETVLDAGAGTGAVTAELARRLPDGRVIALDAAPAMVDFARRRFDGTENVEVMRADLADFDLGGRKVDVVFSTATFHWLPDHDRLWHNLRAVMNDGGRLVAQCGGEGNIARFEREFTRIAEQPPFDEYVGGLRLHHFAGPVETEQRMRDAGFSAVSASLEHKPVHPDDPPKHLREIMLGAHAERMPADVFERFAAEVDAATGAPSVVDYVRLNVDAIA